MPTNITNQHKPLNLPITNITNHKVPTIITNPIFLTLKRISTNPASQNKLSIIIINIINNAKIATLNHFRRENIQPLVSQYMNISVFPNNGSFVINFKNGL